MQRTLPLVRGSGIFLSTLALPLPTSNSAFPSQKPAQSLRSSHTAAFIFHKLFLNKEFTPQLVLVLILPERA